VRGPWKNPNDIWRNKDPKLKNKLNLDGDIKIKGKNVRASNKNKHPTPKKAANA
jgi:hypothetical protein